MRVVFRIPSLLMLVLTVAFSLQAENLVQIALAQNLDVQAAESRVLAVEALAGRAGAWSDPVIKADYSNMPINKLLPGNHAMSGIQFGLAQKFPWPGQISNLRKAEQVLAQKEKQSLVESKLRLVHAVLLGHLHLSLLRELYEVTGEHLQLTKQLLGVIESNYRTGKAKQFEMLKAQLLQEKLVDQSRVFKSRAAQAEQTLNALLHRKTSTPIKSIAFAKNPPTKRSLKDWIDITRVSHPGLKKMVLEKERQRHLERWALYKHFPDMTLHLGYRLRAPVAGLDKGTDFVSLGVSLPLPLWSGARYGSQKQSAIARQVVSERMRWALDDGLVGKLAHAYEALGLKNAQLKHYETKLIPLSFKGREAAFAAYKVGQASFLEVFFAEEARIEWDRAHIESKFEREKIRVDLQTFSGEFIEIYGLGEKA